MTGRHRSTPECPVCEGTYETGPHSGPGGVEVYRVCECRLKIGPYMSSEVGPVGVSWSDERRPPAARRPRAGGLLGLFRRRRPALHEQAPLSLREAYAAEFAELDHRDQEVYEEHPTEVTRQDLGVSAYRPRHERHLLS